MLNLSYIAFATAYRRYAHLDKATLLQTLGLASRTPAISRNGALLTSLALISTGISLDGPLQMDAGPLAGKKLHFGSNCLADWLAVRHGAPESIPTDLGLGKVAHQLHGRRGIVAFIQGTGPKGGDMDLLDGSNAHRVCLAAETRHPVEVRFWEIV